MSPHKRIASGLFLCFCALSYGVSAIRVSDTEPFSINIDLARPESVSWPCEISVVGDMGEKGLRIPPNVGSGWRGKTGGNAVYRFYAPHEGRYCLWAYARWFDVCANAIFAQIDGADKVIIGNDPVYGQWHWVRGFRVYLTKGTHTMVLSNHSDHIAMQKILLTYSSFAEPHDNTPVFSDIFYDGFDGCDRGNLKQWRAVRGRWGPHDPEDPTCAGNSSLVRTSQDDALIVYGANDWSGYSLSVSVRTEAMMNTAGVVGLCFGVKDSEEYYELALTPGATPDTAAAEVFRRTGDRSVPVTQFEIPWKDAEWHQLDVFLYPDNVRVQADDGRPVRVPVNREIAGGIGLHAGGDVTAYFDDIHVRQITDSWK